MKLIYLLSSVILITLFFCINTLHAVTPLTTKEPEYKIDSSTDLELTRCTEVGSVSGNNKNEKSVYSDSVIQIPLAGNTWTENVGSDSLITNSGIENWTNAYDKFETYFRVTTPGLIRIKLKAKTDSRSQLQLSIGRVIKKVIVQGQDFKLYDAGEWTLQDTGYIKITLSGLTKTGKHFAEISEYEVAGKAVNSNISFVKNNEENFFYWGRRGPSVHFSYPFNDTIKAKWFYNEITVPEGKDVIGSYFMADGFGEGYFGIQVNSATERRVLFSVWSPFNTDDPKSIPKGKQITLQKKGEGVYTGEFGNEGSGGQSFLRYNWKAGTTYKFLLNGYPDNNGNTIYTAYLFAPETKNWMLIASFKRPETTTYLKQFHSFSENFIPAQGNTERRVLFNNQWICDVNENWIELTKAVFTYDNTAKKGYRMDYAGGIENGGFYLKNCGFFNQYTSYRSVFERPTKNNKPHINFSSLP